MTMLPRRVCCAMRFALPCAVAALPLVMGARLLAGDAPFPVRSLAPDST